MMFPLYPHVFPIKMLGFIPGRVCSTHNPLAAALDLIDAKLNHVRSTMPVRAVGGCWGKYQKKHQKTWKSWVTP